MKHLRKSFLTLLALTLFGGAGAWAQGQLLTTINASSGFTNGTQTFDNIVTVTLNGVAYSANYGWYCPGSPGPVEVAPVNGVTVTGYMLYFSATDPIEFEGSSFTVALEGNRVLADDILTQLGSVGITKIEVYGTAPAQEIELTKVGENQWSLGQTPDYDLELQVEYYEQHALKNIPAGWTVKINGTELQAPYQGDSLLISETDSVTLVPDNPHRVKSVTLVNESTPVESITLNKTATTISAGQTETLSVSSVTPDDATDQTVTWSSDNEAVATVDADGKVTAVAFGTANITATANDGSGVTATCAVTVSKVVTINQSDWGNSWSSFTKDGVTVSAGIIDSEDGNLMEGGTFSTTLGNFTKIVVTAASCYAFGTGWSGGSSSKTWAGTPASTVSFSGDFMGFGMTQTTIVCTIEPTN